MAETMEPPAAQSMLELVPPAVALLARGEPVEVADLAEAVGWPVEKTNAVLAGVPRVDWDDSGRLAGLGLTLQPTGNRFVIDGRTLFTWCATDTLLFPLILGRAAQVSATCPVTRQPITLTVAPEGVSRLTPATAVVSRARTSAPVADFRTEVCDQGHFFGFAGAAGSWQADHPGVEVQPVAEAFEAARQWHANGGWASGEAPC